MGRPGKKICCLQGLADAATERRAVVVPQAHCWTKPTPAAFMLQQHGITINRLLNVGIYIYEKENHGSRKDAHISALHDHIEIITRALEYAASGRAAPTEAFIEQAKKDINKKEDPK